jgi:hypothetical protein
MNRMAGAVTIGVASGRTSGPPAGYTAGLSSAGRRQWPGMRPWPLFSALGPLGALPTAPGGDGSPRYQADGRLTELWLRLMSDRALLRVEVWDNLPASAGVPEVHRAGAGQEHGRGLEIVDQLSRRWGFGQIPGLEAKSVWALLKAQ